VIVEFTQVKSNKLNQLWSLSKLCSADESGLSIIERSLAYDRCSEPTTFRLITAIPFNAELSILTLARECSERASQQKAIDNLAGKLPPKLVRVRSPNGATCRDWLNRSLLECQESEQAVRSRNLLALAKILEQRGTPPLQGQLDEVYARLLGNVSEASKLNPKVDKIKKRFTMAKFTDLLATVVQTLFGIPAPTGGKRLKDKMQVAGLPTDTILQAQEQRRLYRARSLTPRYLEIQMEPNLDEEVLALLSHLRAQLDSGGLPDSGPAFHTACLNQLSEYRASLPARRRPSLADLHGSMYNIADRCLHRFRRATG
jgi:hypothetical protein